MKDDLRKQIKESRRTLDEASREVFATEILKRLQNFLPLLEFRTYLLYAPIRGEGEISTWPLFQFLSAHKKRIFYPRTQAEGLSFHEIVKADELSSSTRIPSPGADAPLWTPGEKDVVIVPGLVFDRCGHRLGFGKGYYDRFLNRYPRLLRIGWAYPFQVTTASLPIEPHDQRMDWVLTPEGIWGSRRLI